MEVAWSMSSCPTLTMKIQSRQLALECHMALPFGKLVIVPSKTEVSKSSWLGQKKELLMKDKADAQKQSCIHMTSFPLSMQHGLNALPGLTQTKRQLLNVDEYH